MCPSTYIVSEPCYSKTDESTCNSTTSLDVCSNSDYDNEGDCINNGAIWQPPRCEYKNGNCYPIGENSIQTCCEKKSGYCIDNFDPQDDYNADECNETYQLTSNKQKKQNDTHTTDTPHVCCENISGYCSNNTDPQTDIDCSVTNQKLKENSETIQCTDSSCDTDQCCDDITDKCSNNTDPANDVDCSEISGGNYTLRSDGVCIDAAKNINEEEESACTGEGHVWITFDEIDGTINGSQDSKCCRELEGEDTCGGFINNNGCNDGRDINGVNTWGNGTPHHKPKTGVDTTNIQDLDLLVDKINTCCEIRENYCRYNTDSNDDFDCTTFRKADKDVDVDCGDDGCDEEKCCVNISGKCRGNTNSGEDIICNQLGKYQNISGTLTLIECDESEHDPRTCSLMEDKSNIDNIPGISKDTCCNDIEHKCGSNEGNTIPFDCLTEIKDENGTILRHNNKSGDISCKDGDGNNTSCRDINRMQSLAEHSSPGSLATQCCDPITEKCSGNTSITDNVNCDGVGKSLTNGKCFDQHGQIIDAYTTSNTCTDPNTWKLPSEIDKVGDGLVSCCETITGKCSGNTDSNENVSCPEPSQLKRDSSGNFIDKPVGEDDPTVITEYCCEKVGLCFGNDTQPDFDCSSHRMKPPSEDPLPVIHCGNDGCSAVSSPPTQSTGCCIPITGKCSGNTEPSEDVICTALGSQIRMDSSSNPIDKPEGTSPDDTAVITDHCCEIKGMCAGNTDETDDIECSGRGPKYSNKGSDQVGRNDLDCCDIIGYCQENTDPSHINFDDNICNTILNPPVCKGKNQEDDNVCGENTDENSCGENNLCEWSTSDNQPATLKQNDNQTGHGWDEKFLEDVSEEYKAQKCCIIENAIHHTQAYSVGQFTTAPVITCEGHQCLEGGGQILSPNPEGITCEEGGCTDTICCIDGFTNMEGFTNISQIFNIDDSIMLIEGAENQSIDEKIQEDCNTIKEDMLNNLEISESQFSFACRLEGDEYIVNTAIIPLEGEELPSELIEKVKDGIPVSSVKEKKEKKKMNMTPIISVIISLIVIILIYAYYF
tara:strand:- start:1479 stop:4640 length:3162 start_codon:yes stop_codon:yes gene_type:complete